MFGFICKKLLRNGTSSVSSFYCEARRSRSVSSFGSLLDSLPNEMETLPVGPSRCSSGAGRLTAPGQRREYSTSFTQALGLNRNRRGSRATWHQLSLMTEHCGIYTGRRCEVHVEPTYGVGPVGGPDRDPRTKGSTPDDFRADYIHMAEPKEITKQKAAIAQQEPPDFQVNKTMFEWSKPVEEKAEPQRGPADKVFEDNTRKVEGTAQKQGNTTGNESGKRLEGQYGATPDDGKTSRS